MLSGIGPGRHLQEHGIGVVADVPGVGENFHDHASATCTYRTAPGNSLNRRIERTRGGLARADLLCCEARAADKRRSQATALARGLPDTPVPTFKSFSAR